MGTLGLILFQTGTGMFARLHHVFQRVAFSNGFLWIYLPLLWVWADIICMCLMAEYFDCFCWKWSLFKIFFNHCVTVLCLNLKAKLLSTQVWMAFALVECHPKYRCKTHWCWYSVVSLRLIAVGIQFSLSLPPPPPPFSPSTTSLLP